jgi:hypothetical protein
MAIKKTSKAKKNSSRTTKKTKSNTKRTLKAASKTKIKSASSKRPTAAIKARKSSKARAASPKSNTSTTRSASQASSRGSTRSLRKQQSERGYHGQDSLDRNVGDGTRNYQDYSDDENRSNTRSPQLEAKDERNSVQEEIYNVKPQTDERNNKIISTLRHRSPVVRHH